MASELYYELHMLQKGISHLNIKKSIHAIREVCDYAIIDPRIVEIVKDPQNAAAIYEHTCKHYKLSVPNK